MIFFNIQKKKIYCDLFNVLFSQKKKKLLLSNNIHFFFSMYNSFILGLLSFFFFFEMRLLRLYVHEGYKCITK